MSQALSGYKTPRVNTPVISLNQDVSPLPRWTPTAQCFHPPTLLHLKPKAGLLLGAVKQVLMMVVSGPEICLLEESKINQSDKQNQERGQRVEQDDDCGLHFLQAKKPQKAEVRASQHFRTEAYWEISKVATHTLTQEGEGTPSSEIGWVLCETKYPAEVGETGNWFPLWAVKVLGSQNFNLQKLTFECRFEQVKDEAMWMSEGRAFQEQQCKGPEVGSCLMCWKYSKEATVAGAKRVGGE